MESEMSIDARLVRQLREKRAWSQEHLAQAAGIGVRTLQRLESEGRCSAETRLALAAAFGVDVAFLDVRPGGSPRRFNGLFWGTLSGFCGVTVGMVCADTAIAHNAAGLESGMEMGLIGLFAGLSYAALGLLHRYFRAWQLR